MALLTDLLAWVAALMVGIGVFFLLHVNGFTRLELPALGLALGLITNQKIFVYLSPNTSFWLAMAGQLILPAVSYLLFHPAHNVMLFLTASFWAWQAMLYTSYVLGTMSMVALLFALGLTADATPLCYMIGFKSRDHLLTVMNASFYIMFLYLILTQLGLSQHPYVVPFRYGILVFGTMVFYLSILINSSSYYRDDLYVWSKLNFLAVAALLLGVYAVQWNPEFALLSNVANVFSMMFLCEKFWDIRWDDTYLGAAFILFGGILYALSFWLREVVQALHTATP